MKNEKMTVTQTTAPENAGEAFEIEAPRFQEGGQHDLHDRGYGSGIGVHQRGANDPNAHAPDQATVPDFVQSDRAEQANLVSMPQEQPNYQQMYGQSENEKGQWRKTADQAMQELTQLRAELGALRAVQPQHQYQQAPAQAPAAQQLPDTFFPGKEEGDLVEVKDVDAMVRSAIAPAVMQIHNQQQQLYQQQMAAQKAASGITPAIEQQVMAEAPWLNSVQEGPARIQAMQSFIATRQQAQAPRGQNPNAPQQAQVNPEQAAARRVTYIESGQQTKPSETEVPVQQRIAQEFSQATTAADKKKVLMKYGMNRVNDWGPDVWGPAR